MGIRDRRISDNIGLTQADIAKYLGKTRQAINRGFERDSDYLDIDRLTTIYKQLQHYDPEKAEKLILAIGEEFSDAKLDPSSIRNASCDIPNQPTHTDAKEIWIFSHKPLELEDPSYLASMECQFLDSSRRFIYFVPDEYIANRLKLMLQPTLARLQAEQNKTATIEIFECNAVSMMPHLILLDPSGEIRGAVLRDDKDDLAILPMEDTLQIHRTVWQSGLGRDPKNFTNHFGDTSENGFIEGPNGVVFRHHYSL